MSLLHTNARNRLLVAGGVMALVGASPPYGYGIVLRSLCAWSAGTLFYLALVWRLIRQSDAEATRKHSMLDDPSRPIVEMILVGASLVSLVGVFLALVEAGEGRSTRTLLVSGLAILSAAVSWVLTHTVYAMHYARLYYHDDDGKPAGGMDFHCDEPPDYRDFCYYSFSVATTFGATDVDLTNRIMRRTTMAHSLLSFALATINLTLALNVVTSLLASKS